MTLSVAWIRKVNNTEELMVATDSRLRWGRAWDCCPKIFPLVRQDSVLCFAGNTQYAYPMMLQINNSLSMHGKSSSRALDITDVKGHILKVIEGMRDHIHDLPRGSDAFEAPDALFIFAGYSWKTQSFKIWTYYYDPKTDKFSCKKASSHRKKLDGTKYYAFIGDNLDIARKKTTELLIEKGLGDKPGLDMEPLEVLIEMIRDEKYPHIGGSPQVVKVYKHMNTMPYSVYWPNKESNQKTFLGRPMLDYEVNEYFVLDPDTMKLEKN
ncbi:hypothetical protein P3580_23315 [Vibrio parahaemolyticus]|nr:hypothetical protein [Vibrio parahaemolyticus]HBC3537116.1 hypothetical protein [Vibrio parahaemolyticus]HBC3816794.1 hypothetical protein [Vibrio parahaemolyticus]